MPELREPKSLTRFENKTFTVKHAGMTAEVEGLSGWRWAACAEVSSTPRAPAATRRPVTPWCGASARQSQEIRRIRRKLGLRQIAVARLTGGGHNALSRYERGEAAPLPAVVNLFRLLDKHRSCRRRSIEAAACPAQNSAKSRLHLASPWSSARPHRPKSPIRQGSLEN